MKGIVPLCNSSNNSLDCTDDFSSFTISSKNNNKNCSLIASDRKLFYLNENQTVSIKCNSEPSLSSPSSASQCSYDSSVNSSPSKLALSKTNDSQTDLIEDICVKKLSRGISRATDNVNLVSKARNEFAQDFRTSSRGSRLLNSNNILETPDYTFTLPDLSIHPEDFRIFLEHDLIEKSTLVSLESAGRLNWWADLGTFFYFKKILLDLFQI